MSDSPAALWIDRASSLAEACARWRAGGELALDTEFVFERTFFPRLGLIQVAAAGEVALIDPLAVGDLSPLAALLADPGLDKVLHSAGQDQAVLARATGAAPRPLFDTQVAAALCGLGPALSYAALVETLGNSKMFAEPKLQGVIQPDPATGKERFELIARVRKQGAADAH